MIVFVLVWSDFCLACSIFACARDEFCCVLYVRSPRRVVAFSTACDVIHPYLL